MAGCAAERKKKETRLAPSPSLLGSRASGPSCGARASETGAVPPPLRRSLPSFCETVPPVCDSFDSPLLVPLGRKGRIETCQVVVARALRRLSFLKFRFDAQLLSKFFSEIIRREPMGCASLPPYFFFSLFLSRFLLFATADDARSKATFPSKILSILHE